MDSQPSSLDSTKQSRQGVKNYTCTHNDLDVLQKNKTKNKTAMQFLNLNSQLREEKKSKVERQRSELFPKERVKLSQSSCTGDEELTGEL